jgi:hypothetical protein
VIQRLYAVNTKEDNMTQTHISSLSSFSHHHHTSYHHHTSSSLYHHHHHHHHPLIIIIISSKGLVHYNGNREKSFMQRILKKLQQIDSHSHHHSHSNHSTTTITSATTTSATATTTSTATTITSTINHVDNVKLGHELHYCSKHTNDNREQLWCELAFKTFNLATKYIKNNIFYLSNRTADIGVLNI